MRNGHSVELTSIDLKKGEPETRILGLNGNKSGGPRENPINIRAGEGNRILRYVQSESSTCILRRNLQRAFLTICTKMLFIQSRDNRGVDNQRGCCWGCTLHVMELGVRINRSPTLIRRILILKTESKNSPAQWSTGTKTGTKGLQLSKSD
jgi:hypothetical protein